jgi:hypothetical protein
MYDTVLKSIDLDSSNRHSFLYSLTKRLRSEFCFNLQVNLIWTTPRSALPLSAAVLTHWSFTNAWWVCIRSICLMNTVYITGFNFQKVATFGTKSAVGYQDCNEGNQSRQNLNYKNYTTIENCIDLIFPSCLRYVYIFLGQQNSSFPDSWYRSPKKINCLLQTRKISVIKLSMAHQ